ncbi:MAG: hypothetical protein EOO71_29735 [Myxococcaceae bacterium]|nr:MAG: hypothetical protein EOO71_29735 [Myxococcaceae bacterium]
MSTPKSMGFVLATALMWGSLALASPPSPPDDEPTTAQELAGQELAGQGLPGLWRVSTTWTSGWLAGNSGTSRLTFYGDGSYRIDDRAIDTRDSWGGSNPNYVYRNFNPNTPGSSEYADRVFTLNANGSASTTCQATYYHPSNGISYGTCQLIRVIQFPGSWEVYTYWTSGWIAGNSGTYMVDFFDNGTIRVNGQPLEARDYWYGSYPNYGYVDYNINAPYWDERGVRSFTLNAAGTNTIACQATAYHPSNGTAYGVCALRRLSYFDYSASNTNSGQQNTVDVPVSLDAGQTLTVGTCGLVGVSATGDTYLRLFGAQGQLVALNDDACSSYSSNLVYTAPSAGTYVIKAGCYSGGSCGGRVGYIAR